MTQKLKNISINKIQKFMLKVYILTNDLIKRVEQVVLKLTHLIIRILKSIFLLCDLKKYLLSKWIQIHVICV